MTEISYTCNLKSYSRKTIEGVKASYVIYKRTSIRSGGDSGADTEEIAGTAEVGTLKPNGQTEFASEIVECVDSSERGVEVAARVGSRFRGAPFIRRKRIPQAEPYGKFFFPDDGMRSIE